MKTYGTKNAACSSKFSLTGEEHYATAQRIALRNRYPRLWRRCGWGTRDPVTIQLFFTTFSPTANPILTANATLNGSSLTFSGTSTIAHTNGTDGIRFLPDNNLAIGGRAAAWLQGTFSILPTRARASPPLLRPVTAPTSPLTVVPG